MKPAPSPSIVVSNDLMVAFVMVPVWRRAWVSHRAVSSRGPAGIFSFSIGSPVSRVPAALGRNLLHEPGKVGDIPPLNDLSVRDADDAHARGRHVPPGGRDTSEIT